MRRAAVGSGTSQPQLWLALGKWIDPIPQARVRASNLRKYRKEEPQPPRERQPEEVDDSRSTQAPARARAPPDNEERDPPYISRCGYAGFLLYQPRCGCSTMRDTGSPLTTIRLQNPQMWPLYLSPGGGEGTNHASRHPSPSGGPSLTGRRDT